MADIYVDPTAVTNGTGSQANPRNIWPTGIGAFDTVNLLGGTRLTVSNQLSLGAGSNNVVQGYFPSGRVAQPIITSTATNQSMLIVERPGVTEFNGIHFDQHLNMGGNGGAIGTAAVAAGRHASIAIRNCKFTGMGFNAILLNGTNTANAPTDFVCVGNIFDDIGADCVFGGALRYEFAHNRCTRMSSRGTNGDAVGFINADPEFVWLHHNYVDHSAANTKQCFIIDATTVGAGVALIEDNILIGFGSAAESASTHTVIISEPVTTIRRNLIYTYGLTCGVNNALDSVTDNLFLVGNVGASNQAVTMAGNGLVANNTFIATGPLSAAHAALATNSAVTGAARITNNVFSGFQTAIRSGSLTNPTATRNAYFNCGVRRSATNPFLEPSELAGELLLGPDYRPRVGSPLLRAGMYIGPSNDLSGRYRGLTPSVGAFEFAN